MTTVRHHLSAPGEPLGHAHPADLEACLDLINTLELEDGVPGDHIATVEDALGWFAARSLAHETSLRAEAEAAPDDWLARLRDVRGALRETWDATVEERPPDAGAVAVMNDLLGHAPRAEVRPAVTGVAVGHRHDEADATGEALARLAVALVDTIAAGDTGRFRICANDGCRWVFEDTSRAGRRRWCDMRSCGNRDKVRRYRSRRRDPGGDAPAASA